MGDLISWLIVFEIFEISIGIFTDNGNNEYIMYCFSENLKNGFKLLLLFNHNNNHFDLIYDKKLISEVSKHLANLKDLKLDKSVSKFNFKY